MGPDFERFMGSVRKRMIEKCEQAQTSGALSGDENKIALYKAVLCIIAESDVAYSKQAQELRSNLQHFI